MIKRWQYRFYPTPEQEEILGRTFGCVRFAYNWALATRTEAHSAGRNMTYADSDRALTALKREPETKWLADVSCVPLQQSLRDLQSAFKAFFDGRARYPKFKKKSNTASARYTKSGFTLTHGRRLYVGRLGVLRIRWDRPLPAHPSSLTLIRRPSGRYFVSFVVDVPCQPLPKTGRKVGVDVGIKQLATLSNGDRVENPRHLDRWQKRLSLLQRRAAKKSIGSNRRAKAMQAVARCHEKISNSRKDALHKLTKRLIADYDVICIETLHVRSMVKNQAVARGVLDASLGMVARLLEEKAQMYGKVVIKIDRWFPSTKMCSACGHIQKTLPLSVRYWECPMCHSKHDRDENAAKNILAAGHAVSAHGEGLSAAARLDSGSQHSSKCEPLKPHYTQ